jgi:hypothetical protein
MTTSQPIYLVCLLVLALLVGAPSLSAVAQTSSLEPAPLPRTIAVYAGAWNVDLRGTTGGVRLELPRPRHPRWTWVAALTYFDPSTNSPYRATVVASEGLVQYQLTGNSVRPYIGAGAGLAFGNLIHTIDPVLSLGAGLQTDISDGWGARLEAGLRTFGRIRIGTVGWSFGVARRL